MTIPLSFGQERLWYLEQLEGSGAYNIASSYRLTGELNLHALRGSVKAIAERHAVLRTCFRIIDHSPVQVIAPTSSAEVPVIDLSDDGNADLKPALERVLARESARSFDLEAGPPFRVTVVRLEAQTHVLHIVAHHTVFDGWSADIFMRELTEGYAALMRGVVPDLPELAARYSDYAVAQRRRYDAGDFIPQLDFWREQLRGAPPALEIPPDYERPAMRTANGARAAELVPKVLGDRLRLVARRHSASLFMVLLAAFKILLWRYSRQNDIVVGTPVANRSDPKLEALIGFFSNTIVLRTRFEEQDTFGRLLQQIRETCFDAFANQGTPFAQVVQALQPVRDLARTPVFQVLFGFQERGGDEFMFPGLRCEKVDSALRVAQTDLNLRVVHRPDGLRLVVEYSTDLFHEISMTRFLRHYHTLLETVADDPGQKIRDLTLLPPEERHTLLEEWNASESVAPSASSIHEMFQQQAVDTPDAVAVEDKRTRLTYRELEHQSSCLARHLREIGVTPGDLVGICLHRSSEMVVALLGILKAGAAYLPLDPAFPKDRLSFMLHDANVTVIVSHTDLVDRLASHRGVVVALDTDMPSILGQDRTFSSLDLHNLGLAYVIYTSGSTGTPKGVRVPHSSVVNFLASMHERPGLSADDILLAVTTLSFDISVLEIFLPLTVGARVFVADAETASDGKQLAAAIEACGATVMQATPATWRLLFDAGWRGGPTLRVFCGGEALAPELAQRLVECVSCVWNMYGPTESTVWSTCGQIPRNKEPIAVGRPIANTQLYIFDADRRLAPIGIPGELYIGGAGVSDGYLDRPELTADRFVSNPFGTDARDRLYRTGDLCRWRHDGQLQHLGRIDRQIKVRGFRIEPGEIETALARHTAIKECVVEPRRVEVDDVRLVAYVVYADNAELTVSEVRQFLRQTIPDYMVPGLVFPLDSVPLTPNGKIDRNALPDPFEFVGTTTDYVPPSSGAERVVADVWQELLGVDRIGCQDNFFELGGHSLLSMRAVYAVQERTGHRLDPRLMFFQTLEQIAAAIPDPSKV